MKEVLTAGSCALHHHRKGTLGTSPGILGRVYHDQEHAGGEIEHGG